MTEPSTTPRPGSPPRAAFVEDGASADDWRHGAECRGEGTNLHFPIGNTGPALLQIEDAKTVCRRCPVVEACLSFAVDHGLEYGVWGNTSEDERRSLKRRAARARSRMA